MDLPAPLGELSAHLQAVLSEPATPLDVDLLEKCELVTGTREYHTSIWPRTRGLFLHLATLLPQLQQDPSPLTRFIVKLTIPYRFDDVKDLDFEMGLQLEAEPYHSLILSLLAKASGSSSDALALANRPGVLFAVVRLWLCTKDAAIATQAAELLTSLLQVSKNEPDVVPVQDRLNHYGGAPMWKRLFGDRDIYALYYCYTTFSDLPIYNEPSLSKADKSIAQARLLEWLPKVGKLDWSTITSSHSPGIERAVGLQEGEGLLQYASRSMANKGDDILMHVTLVNFFTDLITTVKTPPPHLTHCDSSLSLEFLKQQGIHAGIIKTYTDDIPSLERNFLETCNARYIAEYVSHYPENFEKSAELKTIRDYIQRDIRKCHPSDLSIVAAMPRSSLVPDAFGGVGWDSCILLDIPLVRTTPDALKTLSVIFHGPPEKELTFPPSAVEVGTTSRHLAEKAYARLLTSLYYTKNPDFFQELVKHAETVAMKEHALAALTIIGAIVTANWDAKALPERLSSHSDPVLLRLQQFPETGVAAVVEPAISGQLLPYLLRPATSFSNLVGGRGGVEDAAYQVAMAKFDVLRHLRDRLESEGGRSQLLGLVQRRVSEGPWGVGGNAGSRIGTLEA
ncbi:hypothetical protein M011DRAFT_494046 [Sporormia fimetaria CBS 119925]|uniref:Uncharacterized protein n=1 Tax=Sporormia fimetaria CBS 119925 TaxID=1340428 RepID=A0A6A6VC49_9PLEO|nr:hypothetical protein M011DRAFT_494046 [Sporormia fimetaria CBS 119925]